MKKIIISFAAQIMTKQEMKKIVGGVEELSEEYPATCQYNGCPETKVSCNGACTAENRCAWCDADKEKSKLCCLS